MGTREVLKVHKEKQSNGKIFEKWQMGDYHWRSYAQVDKRVNMIASGLTSLGQQVFLKLKLCFNSYKFL